MIIKKKERFKVGAWYKTLCFKELGPPIPGVPVKCLSISEDRTRAVFLIKKKQQEYELMGETVCPELEKDDSGHEGFIKSEVAIRPWSGAPVNDPYMTLRSHRFFSRIAEARKEVGLTQTQLSEMFGIPKRTIENWESGVNIPKEYVENSILEKLEELKKGQG